jgi:heterodisulfide reductase subunit A-like polyferredoxin/coenzyme F420-reducing hydrogenase delta subunit
MADQKEKLEEIGIPISTRVLVVGSGLIAGIASKEMAKMGHDVLLCTPEKRVTWNGVNWNGEDDTPVALESTLKDIEDDPRIQILAPAKIRGFYGSPGRFYVELQGDGAEQLEKEVGALVLATDAQSEEPFEAWGLEKSERICSLPEFEKALNSEPEGLLQGREVPSTVVFLCGFTHHSYPFSQKRAMQTALRLASEGENRVFFLLEHFKVADYGVERLSRKAREAGVLFVKLTGTRPEIQSEGSEVTVTYYDEGLGEKVTAHPDLLVLEETYKAPEQTAILSEKLGVSLDRNGFFQGDNVYNRPIYTNRAGVWVVGSAKGPVSLEEGIEEAKAVALEIHQFMGQGHQVGAEKRVLFDEARCGRCLTCYRSCPHCAISSFESKPVFYHLACKACGICAAGCPGDAIQIPYFTDQEIKSRIESVLPDESGQEKGDSVRLVAFCCENSAFEAARLSALKGLALPEGLELVKVPCAGSVDLDYLLMAFDAGADGVMILGCHHESCKSVKGNTLAKTRVEIIREALGEVGLEKERVLFGSVAPGMSSEFVNIAEKMAQIVRDLGESPVRTFLKKQKN